MLQSWVWCKLNFFFFSPFKQKKQFYLITKFSNHHHSCICMKIFVPVGHINSWLLCLEYHTHWIFIFTQDDRVQFPGHMHWSCACFQFGLWMACLSIHHSPRRWGHIWSSCTTLDVSFIIIASLPMVWACVLLSFWQNLM